MTYLELGGNQLSGSIPPEIGNLTNLIKLNLFGNQLSGSIPPEIGSLSNLTALYLSDNQLSGPIPPEIGNLTKLKLLWMYDNQLSGAIPPEIGSLTNLIVLYLNNNQLSGTIPTEIGNITNLTDLNLYANQLSGAIPLSIKNLTNLRYLGLSGNQLCGIVPLAVATSASKITDGCNFFNNDSSLCIPDTSVYQAIGQDPICGLALSNACVPNSNDQTSDFDKDGYTDWQEFLNAVAGVTDPQGNAFNPQVQNAPDGVGYLSHSNNSNAFWQMMLPAIIHGHGLQQ